jgi:hypothetical protein
MTHTGSTLLSVYDSSKYLDAEQPKNNYRPIISIQVSIFVNSSKVT